MSHPKESLLIELAAGRLPATEADELKQHAAACPQCSQALREIEQVHLALGNWREVTAGEINLVDRVQAAIDAPTGAPISLFPWWIRSTGIAASVAASIVGGHLLARSFQHPAEESVITLSAMEEHLQIAVLAAPDRTGLADLLDTEPDLEGVTP